MYAVFRWCAVLRCDGSNIGGAIRSVLATRGDTERNLQLVRRQRQLEVGGRAVGFQKPVVETLRFKSNGCSGAGPPLRKCVESIGKFLDFFFMID